MAIPTFEGFGSTNNDTSGSASTTPTPPAHQADDILIVQAINAAGATMSTSTEGWTKFGNVSSTDDFAWWWKRATDSETAGPTITASGTDQFSICHNYRGCITTGSPIDDATVRNANNDTTPDTATITTTGPDRLIVCLIGVSDNTGFDTLPPPAGWTYDDSTFTAIGTGATFQLISIGKAEAGDETGVTAFVISEGENWGSVTFGLKPPSTDLPLQANIGDAWKSVADIQINIGDAWKSVISIKQNIGDAWKDVF